MLTNHVYLILPDIIFRNSLATPYTLMRLLLCPLDALLKQCSILYVGFVVVLFFEAELLCVTLIVLEHVNS